MFERMRLSGWKQPSAEQQAQDLAQDGSTRVKKAAEELRGVEMQLSQLKRMPRSPANSMRVQQLLSKKARLNQSLLVYGNGTTVVETGAELLDQTAYLKSMNGVLRTQSKAMQAARSTVSETETLLESVQDAQQDIGNLNADMGSVIGAFTESTAATSDSTMESYSVDQFYEEDAAADAGAVPMAPAPSAFSIPTLPRAGTSELPSAAGAFSMPPAGGAPGITEREHSGGGAGGDPGLKVTEMLKRMSRG